MDGRGRAGSGCRAGFIAVESGDIFIAPRGYPPQAAVRPGGNRLGRFDSDEPECRHTLRGRWRGHDVVSRLGQTFMAGDGEGLRAAAANQRTGGKPGQLPDHGSPRAGCGWARTRKSPCGMVPGFKPSRPTNAELPVDVAFLSVAEDGRLWAGAGGHVREAIGRQWILEAESLRDVFTGNLSRMGAQADHRGGVWLYDYGRGLSHIAADGQVRQFGPQEGFPGDRVNCFFEDHEGNWWAGLDAEGLVRIRERRFQTIDTSGPVSTKPARSVCEETNGTALDWHAGRRSGALAGGSFAPT